MTANQLYRIHALPTHVKERDRACTLSLYRLSLSVGLEWRDGLERGAPCWAQRGEIF